MMFGFANSERLGKVAIRAVLPLLLSVASWTVASAGELGVAVVPSTIVYPGQEIDAGQVRVVEVSNPNLVEGYARSVNEVQGMISTRTLLPGRTIMLSALRRPFTVKRGDKAVLIYDNGTLRITASGTPLADANTGDLIRARNTDSGVIISGTVMADGTILVAQK
jgi:flagellar basal body P-ring formation protein FlgA